MDIGQELALWMLLGEGYFYQLEASRGVDRLKCGKPPGRTTAGCAKGDTVLEQRPHFRAKPVTMASQAPVAVAVENALVTRYPDVAKEWHPELNGELDPHSVSWGSRRQAWWRCSVCAHEWYAHIVHRTSHRTGCPRCAPRSRSQVEIAVACELGQFVEFDPDDRHISTAGRVRAWEVDICLRELGIVIEYDGQWWHTGAQRRAVDRAKTRDLAANGWTVIRVRVGLGRITPLDVCIDRDDPLAATAGVLDRLCELADRGVIPRVVKRTQARRYRNNGVLVAGDQTAQVVASARRALVH